MARNDLDGEDHEGCAVAACASRVHDAARDRPGRSHPRSGDERPACSPCRRWRWRRRPWGLMVVVTRWWKWRWRWWRRRRWRWRRRRPSTRAAATLVGSLPRQELPRCGMPNHRRGGTASRTSPSASRAMHLRRRWAPCLVSSCVATAASQSSAGAIAITGAAADHAVAAPVILHLPRGVSAQPVFSGGEGDVRPAAPTTSVHGDAHRPRQGDDHVAREARRRRSRGRPARRGLRC